MKLFIIRNEHGDYSLIIAENEHKAIDISRVSFRAEAVRRGLSWVSFAENLSAKVLCNDTTKFWSTPIIHDINVRN